MRLLPPAPAVASLALWALLTSCSADRQVTPSDTGTVADSGPGDGGPADGGPMDGGGPGDGGCAADEVRGDAGNCVRACATCVTDADCDQATCVVEPNGCSSCQPTPVCQGRGCRAESDCCSGQFCQSPNDPPVCGICMHNPHECGPQQPCPSGQVCIEPPPMPCSSCDPVPPSLCADPCTATSCPPGAHCGDDGACQPDRCDVDFACPPWTDCKPGSGDPHGCALRTCSRDADCAAGVCVKGACAPAAGSCSFAVP